MVSSNIPTSGISGVRLSSVVPEKAIGEHKEMDLTNLDLAFKLHYIKGVYFFESNAIEGFTTYDFKAAMFPLLEFYYPASGRIRRSESGRPFIKCNDAGVRFVEAQCERTLEEWLGAEDRSLDGELAYDQVLGPDLGFSPLIFVQFTSFNCGGLAIGLSWANVLGDVFSASEFMNSWGNVLAGKSIDPSKSLRFPGQTDSFPSIPGRKPFSVEKVFPVGDCWKIVNKRKMQRQSFYINAPSFDLISASIWKSVSKLKENAGEKVTICTRNRNEGEKPNNGMVISTVGVESTVGEVEIVELAKIIAKSRVEENGAVEEMLDEKGAEEADFVVYGSKLTFLDVEKGDFYGLELKGKKPVFVNFMIDGVGDEGVVLVLPGSPQRDGGEGKMVTVVLPEDQIAEVENGLKMNWTIE